MVTIYTVYQSACKSVAVNLTHIGNKLKHKGQHTGFWYLSHSHKSIQNVHVSVSIFCVCEIRTPVYERSVETARIMRGSRGGGGQGVRTPPPPPAKSKNIGFLSNTGPDPLKYHKATKSAFNVRPSSARQRNAI